LNNRGLMTSCLLPSLQELSTLMRYSVNPIVLLSNNGSYTIESEIHDGWASGVVARVATSFASTANRPAALCLWAHSFCKKPFNCHIQHVPCLWLLRML